MKRIALYMLYDADGVVADYIVHKLGKLREHVEKIVVVSNSPLKPEGQAALKTVADVVHVRENVGFDAWAYREGLIDVIGWKELSRFEELLLLNYTFYAPIFPFEEMFSEMARRKVDFWGITAFRGPVPNPFTGIGMLPFHLQSHFIAVGRRMFESEAFREYWERLPAINSYFDSILKHEVRFTEHFEQLGFKQSVYADPKRYADIHPALNAIDLLLADRIPILKRRPFFHDPMQLDRECVDLARALEVLKQTSSYDSSLIWRDITRVAKPRDLYSNATLLEVMSDEPTTLTIPKRKIAVLAHVFFPDLLDEILSYAVNIPQHFDLFLTTGDATKKAQLEKALAKRANDRFTVREVRVVENRGRDVSALVIGLRDVVLSGGYDYVCRLHSKVSPQDPFGMARHFKEHLFENLLSSRPYVTKLLGLFEADPLLGMVMPPVIHQGYPTLGRAWLSNRPGAVEWATKLGIKVPFDDDTPFAAFGSMYWFRPDALRKLFAHPFKWTDFPEEPDYGDGRLPHVLERLIAYAALSSGFTVKCALTNLNAAKNYVKLEYKLQRSVGDEKRLKQIGPLPVPQLKDYVRARLAERPLTLDFITRSYRTVRAGYHFAKRLKPS